MKKLLAWLLHLIFGKKLRAVGQTIARKAPGLSQDIEQGIDDVLPDPVKPAAPAAKSEQAKRQERQRPSNSRGGNFKG